MAGSVASPASDREGSTGPFGALGNPVGLGAPTISDGALEPLAALVRGDYVQQTMGVSSGSFRLPWYAFAPDELPRIMINAHGAWKGTYFGPVHEVRDTRNTEGFISVRVPSHLSRPVQLVWINVLKCKPLDSWRSCRRVSDAEVQCWVQRGWRHGFID